MGQLTQQTLLAQQLRQTRRQPRLQAGMQWPRGSKLPSLTPTTLRATCCLSVRRWLLRLWVVVTYLVVTLLNNSRQPTLGMFDHTRIARLAILTTPARAHRTLINQWQPEHRLRQVTTVHNPCLLLLKAALWVPSVWQKVGLLTYLLIQLWRNQQKKCLY